MTQSTKEIFEEVQRLQTAETETSATTILFKIENKQQTSIIRPTAAIANERNLEANFYNIKKTIKIKEESIDIENKFISEAEPKANHHKKKIKSEKIKFDSFGNLIIVKDEVSKVLEKFFLIDSVKTDTTWQINENLKISENSKISEKTQKLKKILSITKSDFKNKNFFKKQQKNASMDILPLITISDEKTETPKDNTCSKIKIIKNSSISFPDITIFKDSQNLSLTTKLTNLNLPISFLKAEEKNNNKYLSGVELKIDTDIISPTISNSSTTTASKNTSPQHSNENGIGVKKKATIKKCSPRAKTPLPAYSCSFEKADVLDKDEKSADFNTNMFLPIPNYIIQNSSKEVSDVNFNNKYCHDSKIQSKFDPPVVIINPKIVLNELDLVKTNLTEKSQQEKFNLLEKEALSVNSNLEKNNYIYKNNLLLLTSLNESTENPLKEEDTSKHKKTAIEYYPKTINSNKNLNISAEIKNNIANNINDITTTENNSTNVNAQLNTIQKIVYEKNNCQKNLSTKTKRKSKKKK